MPSFKFQAQQRLPGAGGHKLAQARGIQAPQLRAPQQQTVLRGRTVQKQFVAERRSPESFALTDSMQKLGNLFLAKAVKQADEQTTLAASSAISKYRRAVSDAYYSEEGGLWSKTGAEGSTVFNDNKENINALRDGFAEGLDANAKRKYLVSVAGIHNQNLDQLAKKQFNNISQYRQEIRAATEGDDAESMHGFLREQDEFGMSTPNVDAIINTINDTPLGLTEAEAQARKDRMVFSMVQSADALDVNAESMGNLMDAVKHLASQELQNKLAEGLEKYAKNEQDQNRFDIARAKQAKTEGRFKTEQDFVDLLATGKLTPTKIRESDLSGPTQMVWLNRLEVKTIGQANAEIGKRNTEKEALLAETRQPWKEKVMLGLLTPKEAHRLVQAGVFEVEEMGKMLKSSLTTQKSLADVGGKEALAIKKLNEYFKNGWIEGNKKESTDRKYEIHNAIQNTPDGSDPMDVLEKEIGVEKQNTISLWWDGVWGNERTQETVIPPRHLTPEIEDRMKQLDLRHYSDTGDFVISDPQFGATEAERDTFLYNKAVAWQRYDTENARQELAITTEAEDFGYPYGFRQDGTDKGPGFLGEIENADGSISTELTVGTTDVDGTEMDIPLLVPTLTEVEVEHLANGEEPTFDIFSKAVEHAQMRLAGGKSVFAQEGEDLTEVTDPIGDIDGDTVESLPEETEQKVDEVIVKVEKDGKPTAAELALIEKTRRAYGAVPRVEYEPSAINRHFTNLWKNMNFREAFMRDLRDIKRRMRAYSDKNLEKYPNKGRPVN